MLTLGITLSSRWFWSGLDAVYCDEEAIPGHRVEATLLLNILLRASLNRLTNHYI